VSDEHLSWDGGQVGWKVGGLDAEMMVR